MEVDTAPLINNQPPNRIAELKEKYQGGATRGAATLISRAGSDAHPLEYRQKYTSEMTEDERRRHDSGELIFVETGRTHLTKKGKEVAAIKAFQRYNGVFNEGEEDDEK